MRRVPVVLLEEGARITVLTVALERTVMLAPTADNDTLFMKTKPILFLVLVSFFCRSVCDRNISDTK